MMRILLLSQKPPYPVYFDGVTIRVHYLIDELAAHAACHLIAFSDHLLTRADAMKLTRLVTYDLVPTPVSGSVFGQARRLLSPRRHYSRQYERLVHERVKSFSPDVVIAEQTFMAQYVSAFRAVPKIMSAVDAISLSAVRGSAWNANSIARRLSLRYIARQRLLIERRYFTQFDRVVVVSSDDASYLERQLGRPVRVIPNGVDTAYFSPLVTPGRRDTLLFTGVLSAADNEEACLYLLREVFPSVHQKHKSIRFVIAGRDPTPRIRAALPPFVTLLEGVPDIRSAFRDALLYLSPCVYGGGIKNNVLQAMAMGTPVLATPLVARAIGLADGENGFVAERGQTFLTRLLALLVTPFVLPIVGRNGRRHVEEHYTWHNVGDAYLELCSEVIEAYRIPRQPKRA